MYVLYGRRLLLGLIAVISIVITLKGIPHRPVAGIPLSLERVINMRLDMLLTGRAKAIVNGDTDTLMSHYDLDSRYGQWAFEHETRRSAYLQAWSAARGIRFVDTEVQFRITSIELKGTTAWLELNESVKVSYKHESVSESGSDYFGIGTEHLLELAFKDGEWVIRRDWYLDPLDVDASSISSATALGSSFETHVTSSDDFMFPQLTAIPASAYSPPYASGNLSGTTDEADAKERVYLYNRENAVAYANKYCGLAWGCGNNRKYNPTYKNYTGLGGDCTNFASQVLGDVEAGSLPMTYTWRYVPYGHAAGATPAWAQASSLLSFLLSSGRAQRLARGTYADLITISEAHPAGAIGALNRGDLIAYEETGKIAHFAVVVGADSGLYLLVNSHTADRYHVPWDLGWDSSTIFWLLKIVM
jgi:hypothetical protein